MTPTDQPDPGPVYACALHPDRATRIGCPECGRPVCPECMRPGPRGYQCPPCAAAALAPTPVAAQRPRALLDAPATLGLIVLNALVWVAILLTGGSASTLVDRLALEPTARCLTSTGTYVGMDAAACGSAAGQFVPGVADGGYWELVTSMFTHVDPAHILLNMMTLWFLGRPLERYFGVARFLALYLLSGLAGSVAVYWLADPDGATLGASGAIFGLMGALLIVALRNRGNVRDILFWLAVNLVFTFAAGPGISWQGHLGGLVGGAVATGLLVGRLPEKSRWLALGVFLLVLAGATLARTAQLA